jgi:hypothetical protein
MIYKQYSIIEELSLQSKTFPKHCSIKQQVVSLKYKNPLIPFGSLGNASRRKQKWFKSDV